MASAIACLAMVARAPATATASSPPDEEPETDDLSADDETPPDTGALTTGLKAAGRPSSDERVQ